MSPTSPPSLCTNHCGTLVYVGPWKRPPSTDVDHAGGHSRTCPHAYDTHHLAALSHAHHAKKTTNEDGGFGRQGKAHDDAISPDDPHPGTSQDTPQG